MISSWFIVPGLAVVILAILGILLTALTVAREWENGSMELLLSTPVTPLEILVGKLLPYSVLGMAGVFLVYLVARLGFGVPFRGSHALFFLGNFMNLTAYLGWGLVISVLARNQQIAMQIAMLSGLLPSILLSGFIFSIENMNPFWQAFTSVFPAKWLTMINRGVFVRGAGLEDLAKPFLFLLAMNVVLIGLAVKKFKADVEP
jgi:ABC-2 type transport system permease protein